MNRPVWCFDSIHPPWAAGAPAGLAHINRAVRHIRENYATAFRVEDLAEIAGMSITGVGLSVGYDSPSQFSREYRRMFGTPPSKDTHLRTPPAEIVTALP
ncbi:helix-turn-helix transcriptional regulator [Micromonospora sp. STR1s_5]|nr:helix-turn-helix transcriptional regulator [Micromonospora sp. STR1s_5]